ncbi:MAG: minor capsid protein [Chloroflexota bacterium]
MTDPLVVQLTREYRQKLLDRDASATAEMVQRWQTVEQSLLQSIIELSTYMAEERTAGNEISYNKLLQLRRYQRLLGQIQLQLAQYNAFADGLISNNVNTNIQDGLVDALNLIDAALPEDQSVVNIAFDRIGVEATENIAALARAGNPLNQILERSYPLAAAALTDKLLIGTARGINPREVARSAVREGLAQGLNHILLVARDQQIRAYREASRQQYQASNVVKQYMRIAAKQTRTCMACLALDGTIYDTDQLMALHPQCRCAMIPLVDGFDPPQFQRGEDWFKQLSPEVQKKMMGEGAYAAWQEGQFEFSRLAKVTKNKTWGPSTRVRPLKELVKNPPKPKRKPKKKPAPTPKPVETTTTQTGEAARQRIADLTQGNDIATQLERAKETLRNAYKNKDYDNIHQYIDEKNALQVKLTAFNEKVRQEVLYVDNPVKINADFQSRFKKDRKKAYQAGLDEFARLIGRSSLEGQTVGVKAGGRGRSYYDQRGTIHMSTTSGPRVVIHELGHWLEDVDPEVHEKALAFYDRRTQGEDLEWLGPGYARYEKTRRDKFLSAYMGKEYKGFDGKRFGSEIVSMGLEYMWEDPITFAEKDPDYFDFIYDLVRG